MAPKSTFTQAAGDAICAGLAEGKSLRRVCRELGMSHVTVLDWARDVPGFSDQYARAREVGNEAEFEDLLERAGEMPPPGPSGAVDAGWVAWKRLEIDTIKWALSKKQPKKYGDKVQSEVSGNVGIQVVTGIPRE